MASHRRRRRRNPKASVTTTSSTVTRYQKGGSFEAPLMIVLGLGVVGLLAYSFLGSGSST
jgi:hypothetical protein